MTSKFYNIKPNNLKFNLNFRFQLFLLILFSALLYWVFVKPISFHDASHYYIAGSNLIDNGSYLIYPYDGLERYISLPFEANVLNNFVNYPQELYITLLATLIKIFDKSFIALHFLNYIFITLGLILIWFSTGFCLALMPRILLIIALVSTPSFQLLYNPTADSFAFFVFSICLFFCMKDSVSVKKFAVLGAFAILAKAQLVCVLLMPLINKRFKSLKDFFKYYIAIGALIGLIVFIFLLVYRLFHPEEPPPFFYLNHYSRSIANVSYSDLFEKLIRNIEMFISRYGVGVLVFPLLTLMCTQFKSTEFRLGFISILFATLPIVVYTFDKTADVAYRYFIYSNIVLLIGWLYVTVKNKPSYLNRLYFLILFLFIGFNLQTTNYFSVISASFSEKLAVLTYPLLPQKFSTQPGVVLTNHAYASFVNGASSVYVPLPTYNEFINSNNVNVDFIFIVNSSDGSDKFFNVDGWNNSVLSNTRIADNNGNNFCKKTSTSLNLSYHKDNGSFIREGNISVYEACNKTLDKFGKQMSNTNLFDSAGNIWLSKSAVNNEDGSFASSYSNIPLFKFAAHSNSNYLIRQNISNCGTEQSKNARLQINWMDNRDKFIKASIKVVTVNSSFEEYKMYTKAPENASYGIVFFAPDTANDVVCFKNSILYGDR